MHPHWISWQGSSLFASLLSIALLNGGSPPPAQALVLHSSPRLSSSKSHYYQDLDLKVQDAIQRRVRNAESGYKPHLVARRDLLTAGVEEKTPFYKALNVNSRRGLPTGCQTCAIVGSAGTVKDSNLGWMVDSSDCVFRLGVSPTVGHEQDVGTKTAVRILSGDSFGDLVQRPDRLSTGPLGSGTWILLYPQNVDLLRSRLLLKSTNVTILTLTQAGESDAKRTFKHEANKLGYKLSGSLPSTLWHAVQATEQSGCKSTKIFGVPGPLFCKKHANTYHGQTASRYWGSAAPPMCSLGKDWGASASPVHDLIMTLSDRRALKGWASEKPAGVTFLAPTWSLVDS